MRSSAISSSVGSRRNLEVLLAGSSVTDELDSPILGSTCSEELDCSICEVSEDVSVVAALESVGLLGGFVESDAVADELGIGSTFS